MQWLYRVIGQAGIFLICAQTVVHFRPKESYDKYLKLLLSVMLLLQLLQPVLTMFGGGKGWNTQEQVAEVVGISRQSYAKWEQGETVPDIEKCDRLASFYGIKLDALMHYDEKVGNTKMAPPPEGKFLWGTVKLGNRGQIVIPKEARDKYGLQEGSRLVVLGDEEGIALIQAEKFESQLKSALELSRKMVMED